MSRLSSVCVYCGSGPGLNPAYEAAAVEFGRHLATAGVGLVYGGGSIGLMGAVAKSVLANGGHVTGVIPAFLSERERMLRDVQDLIVTEDMHSRKKLMFERADAFVALPGGLGTLEETVEMLTWWQLGQHRKPVLLANIEGFWGPLISLIAHMQDEAFIRPGLMVRYLVANRTEDIVPMLGEALDAAEVAHEDGFGAATLGKL